jgi:hypothetical protein
LRPPPSGVEHRKATAPILESFFDWAAKTVAKLSAKSDLAGALCYAIKRRAALCRFVTDGRLEPYPSGDYRLWFLLLTP